jgi:hypothetical protein
LLVVFVPGDNAFSAIRAVVIAFPVSHETVVIGIESKAVYKSVMRSAPKVNDIRACLPMRKCKLASWGDIEGQERKCNLENALLRISDLAVPSPSCGHLLE